MKRQRTKCRMPGCGRQAHKALLCRVHALPVFPEREIMDYRVFEELTAAAHDLLWEMESRTRRGAKQLSSKSPHVERLRAVTRRAQDVLIPDGEVVESNYPDGSD